MIAHVCDQCRGTVGNLLITATPKNEPTRHFCAIICLSAWATTNGHRNTVPAPAPAPAAEPRSKPSRHAPLTPHDDAEILRQYQAGTPVANLAIAFNASRPTIYNAINRAKLADAQAKPAENMPENIPANDPLPRARELVGQLVDGVANKILTAPDEVDDSAAPASESRPKPEPTQVNPTEPVAQSEPTPARPVPRVTVKRPSGKPPITARCATCGRTWNLTGRVLESAVALHEHQKDGHVVDILDQEDTDA